MPSLNEDLQNRVLQLAADELDIPESYYEKAKARYESLGAWFDREDSTIAKFGPKVYAQGSFRVGTVKLAEKSYDLDLVCELRKISKTERSQAWVHEAVGKEIQSYAKEHGMKFEPELKSRCWHLQYAEDNGVSFHLDILAAIPESKEVKERLVLLGVPAERAERAIVFPDKKHDSYLNLSEDWEMSNPGGFAKWFETKMRDSAVQLLKERAEELPPHRWNTPLQKAIRFLKAHRDTMFARNPEKKPASIILTALAARAYEGEADVRSALLGIVERMPLQASDWKVLNPTNPGENFASDWEADPSLGAAFLEWLEQVNADVRQMGHELGIGAMHDLFGMRLGLILEDAKFSGLISTPPIVSGVNRGDALKTAVASVVKPTKPWSDCR